MTTTAVRRLAGRTPTGLMLLPLLLVCAGACKQPSSAEPRGPEAVLEAVRRAAVAADAARLWGLLDQQTQWSVMSTHRAQLKLRQLVERHYTAERRAGELRRTRAAGNAPDAKAFFVRLVTRRAGELLTPLRALRAANKQAAGAGCVTFGQDGALQRFCRGKDGRWGYSQLRQHFEQLKLRATRDLETVREGVALQGGS